MSINKFEQKALSQINLNEGLIGAIAKFFLGANFRNAMREIGKMKKDDPELKAGMASLAQNYKIIKQVSDKLEAEGFKSRK